LLGLSQRARICPKRGVAAATLLADGDARHAEIDVWDCPRHRPDVPSLQAPVDDATLVAAAPLGLGGRARIRFSIGESSSARARRASSRLRRFHREVRQLAAQGDSQEPTSIWRTGVANEPGRRIRTEAQRSFEVSTAHDPGRPGGAG
jgi:hypothetical protein